MRKSSKLTNNIKVFTSDLLKHLIFATENILAASLSKKRAYKIFNELYGFETKTSCSKWLNNLRSQGYIRYFRSSNSVEFTTKTKIKLAKVIANRMQSTSVYCFFSFDVPERLKGNRNKFRKSIKDLGCKQVQRSLWVTNKDIYNLVQQIAEEYKVQEYIISIISTKTDVDKTIENLLNT
ncbi:MAG: hypothetical protein WC451_04220 [Patescibacteria group bacterium]|jgi:hypothetical protein